MSRVSSHSMNTINSGEYENQSSSGILSKSGVSLMSTNTYSKNEMYGSDDFDGGMDAYQQKVDGYNRGFTSKNEKTLS